ncbi:MAG: hypothetical protein ACYC5S_08175, partial [Thiobacillus sp.]
FCRDQQTPFPRRSRGYSARPGRACLTIGEKDDTRMTDGAACTPPGKNGALPARGQRVWYGLCKKSAGSPAAAGAAAQNQTANVCFH